MQSNYTVNICGPQIQPNANEKSLAQPYSCTYLTTPIFGCILSMFFFFFLIIIFLFHQTIVITFTNNTRHYKYLRVSVQYAF